MIDIVHLDDKRGIYAASKVHGLYGAINMRRTGIPSCAGLECGGVESASRSFDPRSRQRFLSGEDDSAYISF